MNRWMKVWLALTLAVMAACSDDGGSQIEDGAPDAGDPDTGAPDADPGDDPDAAEEPDAEEPITFDDPVALPPCQDNQRPVIAAHGFLASGDTWANHAMRFEANGYCLTSFYAFDWNTLDGDGPHEEALDALIDRALSDSGAQQVDLIGHSAGGGLGYRFLEDPQRAARVAHYVHVGSFVTEGPAGPPEAPVPTLNLWSQADLVIMEKGDIEGATNVSLQQEDHYGVATSAASFEAIHRFFHDDQAPSTTAIAADEGQPIYIMGRALTLGENEAMGGATVEVFVVEEGTGRRLERAFTFKADDDGRWGPMEADPGVRYEFRVQGTEAGSVPVHYYREPFVRSNPLVYLRGLPGPGSLAGSLLSLIPFDQDAAVVVVFLANRALRAGEDSLTVGGLELAVDALASPEQTTIALFLYDDGDGASSGQPARVFASFPFLAGADFHSAGDPDASIPIRLNGRDLSAPSWPASTEGATIVVFE